MAELIEMPFGMWTWVSPRNYIIDGGSDPPSEWEFLKGMTLGFSRMPPSTILSGPSVGISPRAVNEHSDWPATEAVE